MQVIYLMVKAYGADKSSQHHSVLHRCRRAWARRALLRTLRLFCACGSSIRWTQAIWSRINLYWCISGANGLISINFAGLWIIAIRKRGRVLQRGSASPAVLGRGRCLPSCISPHLKASHFDYCLFFSFFFSQSFQLNDTTSVFISKISEGRRSFLCSTSRHLKGSALLSNASGTVFVTDERLVK